ncbi:MAG: O-succinylhomoserine sulfhydrylase [Alphaproteobacteria bacterium]
MGNDQSKQYRPATQLVHGGTVRSQFGETSEAIYLTQGYVYDSAEAAEARFDGSDPGFVYSRYANPTVKMFEDRMIALEGAAGARATASGMAAIYAAIVCDLQAGDHVVAAKALFGSCLYIVDDILPRYGIETTLVDGTDLSAWQAAMRPNTKTLFLESPTNPRLEVLDIAAIADIAHAGGARLLVDNVFATPLWQKPMELGADVVAYSATKHIDGQGRCLGGVVLSDEEWVEDKLAPFLKHTGPSLSPFNAWTLLKGLETLRLRVAEQTRSAATLADFLTDHAAIETLLYPGRTDHPQYDIATRQMEKGGTMIAFEVKGGKEAAFRFSNALSLIRLSNNLGDAKSLITHPATTTHQRLSDEDKVELGIAPGLLRFSVGLEDVEDLKEDLDQALQA